LGGTGDLQSASQIQARLGAITSPLTQGQRLEVFKATRDAAPGLDTRTALGIASSAARRVGGTGAGVQNTAAAAGLAGRLTQLGVSRAGRSVDEAFAVTQALGARGSQAPMIGGILEELLAGVDGPERESLGRELLAALTVGAGRGVSPETFRAFAGSVSQRREERTASGLVAFPALQGMGDAAAVLALVNGELDIPVAAEQRGRLAALRGQRGERGAFLATLGQSGAIEAQMAAVRRDAATASILRRQVADADKEFSRITQGQAVPELQRQERAARVEAELAGRGYGPFSQWLGGAAQAIVDQPAVRATVERAPGMGPGLAVTGGWRTPFEVIVRSDGADVYAGG
jgi:hypothetical protein